MGMFLNLFLLTWYFTCRECQGVFILEELRSIYSKAYPNKQYISPNFTMGAKNENVQTRFGLKSWRRCEEPTDFSSPQFQRLVKYYGADFVLNATIENMLHRPRGKIYSGDDYDTKSQVYHIALAGSGSGGCFNLNAPAPLRTLKVWGKCIRVFQFLHCIGWTLAIYPGSKIPSENLASVEFTQIKSIGPCLPNEFLSSSLKTGRAEVVKNPQFKNHNPDLFELSVLLENGHITRDSNIHASSLVLYSLGPRNRINLMYALITKENIHSGQANIIWKSSENFHVNDTEEGDVLGYIIQPKFGGPKNNNYNVFIGSKSTAEFWAHVSSHFPTPTTTTNNNKANLDLLEIGLKFIYEDESQIRPLFFYYYAWAREFISYGRILNGHQDNLRTTQIFDSFEVLQAPAVKINAGLDKLMQSRELTRAGNSTIRNVNFIDNHEPWICSLQRREFLSSFQDIYRLNDSERLEAETEAIERMVLNPVARFYSGFNYTGDFEDFNLIDPSIHGICKSLTRLKSRTKSMATFGTCIRVFWSHECWGGSFLIYPRVGNSSLSQNLHLLDLSDFGSVGACLPGELSQSYFRRKPKFGPKKSSYLFKKFLHLGKDLNGTEVSHGSIFRYTLGPANRTEYIYSFAALPEDYLNLTNFQCDNFPVCRKDDEGKGFCFAIPPILNGPTNQSYNTFEASEDAMEDWTRIIFQFNVYRNLGFIFSVNFQYDEDNSTAPTWIFYHIYSQSQGILYGQVYNGLRGNNSNYPRLNWGTILVQDAPNRFSLSQTNKEEVPENFRPGPIQRN